MRRCCFTVAALAALAALAVGPTGCGAVRVLPSSPTADRTPALRGAGPQMHRVSHAAARGMGKEEVGWWMGGWAVVGGQSTH